jgi:hypothetical protein
MRTPDHDLSLFIHPFQATPVRVENAVPVHLLLENIIESRDKGDSYEPVTRKVIPSWLISFSDKLISAEQLPH